MVMRGYLPRNRSPWKQEKHTLAACPVHQPSARHFHTHNLLYSSVISEVHFLNEDTEILDGDSEV